VQIASVEKSEILALYMAVRVLISGRPEWGRANENDFGTHNVQNVFILSEFKKHVF
jgi:hypothetical protein